MEIEVLNKNFETVHIIDAYKSFIWTERYNKAGDFELFTDINADIIENVSQGSYLTKKDSDYVMMVSDMAITTDVDNGKFINISGYSLEKMLDRRIIWGLKTLNTNLQNGIKSLLDEAIISPKDADRKISNFIFQESTDSKITEFKIEKQYTGTNLYEAIIELCSLNEIGFKIILNSKDQFVFSLYSGEDRSYDNGKNTYVMFSPYFENLVNSNYYTSDENLKTVALIAGEDEGDSRRYFTYNTSNEKGIERRELFVDARDIQSEYYDENNEQQTLTDKEYDALLEARGKEKMLEYTATTAFEGEVDYLRSFVYKRDFFLGDIVEIENEYGFGGTARITEVVTSHDDSEGYSIYPTFELINKEDKEGGNE